MNFDPKIDFNPKTDFDPKNGFYNKKTPENWVEWTLLNKISKEMYFSQLCL